MISIVTLCKSDFPGLVATYNSLCRQTYLDFQWIIVSGDPEDQFQTYFNDHPLLNNSNSTLPITTCFHRPSGIYDAMNKGLHLSSSAYILFLNSGDVLYNATVIEKTVHHITNYPADLFFFATAYRFHHRSIIKYPLSSHQAFIWRNYKLPTCQQGIVYSRRFLSDNQLLFNNRFHICGDFDHCSRSLSLNPTCHSSGIVISIFDTNGLSSRKPLLLLKESLIIHSRVSLFTLPFFLAKQLLSLFIFQFMRV